MNSISKALLIIGLVAIMLKLVQAVLNFFRVYKLARKLPGKFYSSPFHVKPYVQNLIEILKQNERICLSAPSLPFGKSWMMHRLLISSRDPDFINKIFQLPETDEKPGLLYSALWFKDALVAISREKHQVRRKILDKAVSSRQLQLLPEIFDEKSKKMIKKIDDDRIGKEEIDILNHVECFVMESFSKSNLYRDTEEFDSEISKMYNSFFENTNKAIVKLAISTALSLDKPIDLGTRKCTDILDSFATSVLKNYHGNPEKGSTFLDLILHPKLKLDKKDLHSEIFNVILGAFEGISKTSTIGLMMLAMHKDVQQKVANEIEDIFRQEPDSSLTVDFLKKFVYLEMVIKETLRLFPPIPTVARVARADVEINGHLIPKSTVIKASLFLLHRHEKYWGSDANNFRPERFGEELKNPNAFAPFTNGPRICFGRRFGMMAIKIFLINFLRTYKVDCKSKYEDLDIEIGGSIVLKSGYNLSISKK